MLQHLLSGAIAWMLSYILTVTGVLAAPPGSTGYRARTDSKLDILYETPWLILPYPGIFSHHDTYYYNVETYKYSKKKQAHI